MTKLQGVHEDKNDYDDNISNKNNNKNNNNDCYHDKWSDLNTTTKERRRIFVCQNLFLPYSHTRSLRELAENADILRNRINLGCTNFDFIFSDIKISIAIHSDLTGDEGLLAILSLSRKRLASLWE